MSKRFLSLILLFSTLLAACNTTPTPTSIPIPTATATPSPSPLPPTALPPDATPIVISQVMAGKPGDNTYEFIELYNRSTQVVDLKGWAVWYRLPTSKEDLFVFRWQKSALVPPFGRYLLAYQGEEVGLPADAEYEQALNTTGGGLQLRRTDGSVLDAVGWGKAPEGFYEGVPIPELPNGGVLERLPSGAQGNALDSDNNIGDFTVRAAPTPRNSGSPIAPLPAEHLEIRVTAPLTVTPGSQITYTIAVTNRTTSDLAGLTATIPLPEELAAGNEPQGVSAQENTLTWKIPALAAGQRAQTEVVAGVPWAYFTAELRDVRVQAASGPMPAFAAPVRTRIEGGQLTIARAREMLGAEVTIEGTASAYTGAYFAGAGNVKFYLADETAGIQVQVFGGEGAVNVKIGDRVRVRGQVSVYRGSVQIVPTLVPDDVTVLASGGAETPAAQAASLADASQGAANLPGRLVQVEGQVTRVEEFTYSYEIDLAGQDGTLTLYVDKQTGINVEQVEAGQSYQAAGILDLRDTSVLLYPRLQSDLAEVFPAALRLEAQAPTTVARNAAYTLTVSVHNDTAAPLTGINVSVEQPFGVSITEILDGGTRSGALTSWQIASLPAHGGSAVLHCVVTLAPETNSLVVLDKISATAAEWPTPVVAAPVRTFVGGRVPVWAIQGENFRSPYLFEHVTTRGTVTGVFPELGGFFVQGEADADPRTSEGLFVNTGGLNVTVAAGDALIVSGTVREISGQTTLQLAVLDDMEISAHGNALPLGVELDPPTTTARANVYYESLEGMLTQVSGPAPAVAPMNKYGEYTLVLAKHGVSRLYQGEDNGIAIVVDDGSNRSYANGAEMPYRVASGDQVGGLIGPLAYTYGQYKIEPVVTPQIGAGQPPQATIVPAAAGEFSLMTWNVENLFDTRAPHPSDPPLPTRQQYDVDIAKVANTILQAGAPTIVALQEVENIDVLETIATQPALAEFQYQAVLIEGFDSRGIDVGYLVRGDRATVLDVQQRAAPEGITSRPPLILKIELQGTAEKTVVYVINNHFTSMSGGEQSTEAVRTAQAAWNVALVQEIQAAEPDAYIAVVGDLNSYFISPPLQALRQGGLKHVFDACPASRACQHVGQPYTYIYQGQAQVLDHILVSAGLYGRLQRVEVLHVNADYPLPMPEDTSPTHKSDHDPVIVTFGLK